MTKMYHDDQDDHDHDQLPCIQLPPAEDALPQPAQHIQSPPPLAPSLCQPHPPVPRDQELPYVRASPQSIPPEGAGPGAEPVAVPHVVSNTWNDLDVITHAARSLKARVGVWKDMHVPDSATQGLMVAAAFLEQSAQVLEQWMRGPVGDPFCDTPAARATSAR